MEQLDIALVGIGHRLDSVVLEGFSSFKDSGIRKEFCPQKASLPPPPSLGALLFPWSFIDSSSQAGRPKIALWPKLCAFITVLLFLLLGVIASPSAI